MSRSEFILFPWSEAKDLEHVDGPKPKAKFAFDRAAGLSVTVLVPWSDKLANRAAELVAAKSDGSA